MSVKRFTASNMARALELVREEMGPDAIILSTKRVGGKVEIVTSADKDLPTRHAEQHRDFQQQFDNELDQPLQSDEAWKLHDGAKKALMKHKTLESSSVQQSAAQQEIGISSNMEDSARRLAKEIEAAREKMLAAKSAEKRFAEQSNQEQGFSDSIDFNRMIKNAQNMKAEGQLAGLQAQVVGNESESAARNSVRQIPVKQKVQAPVQDQMLDNEELDVFTAPKPKSRKNNDASEKRLNQLQAELTEMRALLEQQFKLQEQQLEKQEQQLEQQAQFQSFASAERKVYANGSEGVAQNLEQMGLSKNNIVQLTQNLPAKKNINQTWKEVMNRLARQIPVDDSDKIDQGGVYALVGATGVGKTTTIAKLAARYVMNHGPNSVAIVTTDTFRIGAYDQLRSLGKILNVPVKVADDKTSLRETLNGLCSYSLVLIDTAGFRHGDPLLKVQDELLASCGEVQRVLVVAANSQLQCLKASAHAYGGKHMIGCVLSKIDESSSLGEAISVISDRNKPLMYVTHGQEIPRDLSLANSQKLVTEAVKRLKQQKADEKAYETGA